MTLSDFQRKKLEKLFIFWDYNNNGHIEENDYQEIARRIAKERGWATHSTEYASMLNDVMADWGQAQQFADADNNNQITITEWMNYYDTVINDEATYRINVLQMTFAMLNAIDTDADGSIDVDGYKMLFRIFDADEAVAASAFKRIDTDNNGTVTVDELLAAFEVFLRGDDPNAAGNFMFGAL